MLKSFKLFTPPVFTRRFSVFDVVVVGGCLIYSDFNYTQIKTTFYFLGGHAGADAASAR